jgi:hypothetical protein
MKALRTVLCLALSLAALSFVLSSCAAPSSSGGGGSPAQPTPTPSCVDGAPRPLTTRVVAPYIDTTLGFDMVRMAALTGVRNYTLAFLVSGGGCSAVWGDQARFPLGYYNEQISALRSMGGDVIPSFGGYNGIELAQACGSADALQNAYQQVIDAYQLTWIDFDIEDGPSGAIRDGAANARRNAALVGLQAANPNLKITMTLPVATTGLTAAGQTLLRDAKCAGVSLSSIAILAMNYGGTQADMGGVTVTASNATLSQLATLGLSSVKLGITVMAGVNDVAGEVFSLADTDTLVTYAKGNSNVGLLSMWSANRDNGGCPSVSTAQSICSGIAQTEFAFANKLNAFQ